LLSYISLAPVLTAWLADWAERNVETPFMFEADVIASPMKCVESKVAEGAGYSIQKLLDRRA